MAETDEMYRRKILKIGFNQRIDEMLKDLTLEEMLFVLEACGTPSDVRETFLHKVAKKLMKRSLCNDDLLIIALSPAHNRNEAAKKLLGNNPDHRQISNLVRSGQKLETEIINRAIKMLDDIIFERKEENKE